MGTSISKILWERLPATPCGVSAGRDPALVRRVISNPLAGLEDREFCFVEQTAGSGPEQVVGDKRRSPISKPRRGSGKGQRLPAALRVRFVTHGDAGGGADVVSIVCDLPVYRAAKAARCGQFRRAQFQSVDSVRRGGCFLQELGGSNGSLLVAGDSLAQPGDGGVGAAAQRGCAAERGVGFSFMVRFLLLKTVRRMFQRRIS